MSMLMDEELWRLLDQFHYITRQRTKKKGWPRHTISRTIGAILANFLLTHEREILEEFSRSQLERILRRLGQSFSESDLALIDPTRSPEDADLRRVSISPPSGSRDD